METDDAVTFLPLAHSGTDGGDGAGNLMPEYLRRLDEAMLNFFEVRTANAASCHPDQNFAFGYFRDRDKLRAYAAWAAIHPGAHLPGERSAALRTGHQIGRHTHVAATISDCERSSRALSNWR